MTGVTNNFGESYQFGYDNANRLSQINRSNNVNSTLSFDNNSFLTNFSHKKGSEIIENFIYTRDQIGNRTAIQTSRGSFSYGYDSENQLVTASHPEADELHALETFTYDSLGNRTSDNQGNYSYDDKKFRLDEDYKYLYVYDLNGNLTSKQEKGMNGEVWNYVYNSENQMIEASYYEGTTKIKTVSFFYDAFGRRVKKAVESFQNNSISERRYAYDSNEIIAELDENNNVLATYTHSGLRTDDVLSAKISSDGVSRGLANVPGSYTYLKDGLGSVQAIVNESGHLVQRYIYSSFGKLLKIVDAIGLESTNIKTGFSYTNREYDEETGLYYYRARFYDSFSGRFMQEDPHPGSLDSPLSHISKYIYTENNPINFTDPDGLFKLRNAFAIYTSYLVGFAIGFGAGFVLGLIMGAAVGGALGYQIGGEVAYFTNRILGGGREESNDLRNKGRTAGLVGGIIGGIVGGVLGNKAGTGRGPAQSNKSLTDLSSLRLGCIGVGLLGSISGAIVIAELGKVASALNAPAALIGVGASVLIYGGYKVAGACAGF